MWVTVKKTDGTRYNGNDDPMVVRANGTVPVINREPLTFPTGITNQDQYLDYLYDNHFEIIEPGNRPHRLNDEPS